jgi:hypothetical protein
MLGGVMQKTEFVRVSPISGKTNTKVFEVDPAQVERYDNGEIFVQEAFPHLDADAREFIMSGITGDEWADIFERGDIDE